MLNFEFKSWNTSCVPTRQLCIEGNAVHEFGHALSLHHEQNRYDTYGTNISNDCIASRQGAEGKEMRSYGPWDPDSIMNYCNIKYQNGSYLSSFDIENLNRLYGGRTAIRDWGLDYYPKAIIDVNGDKFKDYCRFVELIPGKIRISCKLGSAQGFRNDKEYHYSSIDGIEPGDPSLPQYFADVNGDGRADYCRFIGKKPNHYLACNLAEKTSFSKDQFGFRSINNIGVGYAHLPRLMADVNGDGRADYCRFVGVDPKVFLSCNLARAYGFDVNQFTFNSAQGINQGLTDMPRSLTIVSRSPVKYGYCRYSGTRPNIQLICSLPAKNETSGFDTEFSYPVDSAATYNLAPVMGIP